MREYDYEMSPVGGEFSIKLIIWFIRPINETQLNSPSDKNNLFKSPSSSSISIYPTSENILYRLHYTDTFWRF